MVRMGSKNGRQTLAQPEVRILPMCPEARTAHQIRVEEAQCQQSTWLQHRWSAAAVM